MDEELDELNKRADNVLENAKSFEEKSIDAIYKYFDRIHDKLFSFNNILIGAFIAIYVYNNNFPITTVIFPMFNMVFLFYIEFRMMNIARKNSNITKLSKVERDKNSKRLTNTNRISLAAIFFTISILVYFIFKVFELT